MPAFAFLQVLSVRFPVVPSQAGMIGRSGHSVSLQFLVYGQADFFQPLFRIGNQQALLFVQVSELFALQGIEGSDPRSKAFRNSFMERVSSSRLSLATMRPSSRFRRKSSRKFFQYVQMNVAFRRAAVSPACDVRMVFPGRKKTCKAMITTSKQIINPSISFYFGSKIEKELSRAVIKKS